MQRRIVWLLGIIMWGMTACQSASIFQGSSQEKAFRERYMQRPFYTAILIHPYRYNAEYLVDLTGTIAELETETMRAPVLVPLGTPITLVGLEGRYVLARITGYAPLFRLFVHTQRGTLDDMAKEMAIVLSKDPPLEEARPEMRPFIERQEIVQGMTRREVSMSWGLPDKINGAPGASGTIEEWIYFPTRQHLFLDNGLVTNWQQY
jgi:hypothetical protein